MEIRASGALFGPSPPDRDLAAEGFFVIKHDLGLLGADAAALGADGVRSIPGVAAICRSLLCTSMMLAPAEPPSRAALAPHPCQQGQGHTDPQHEHCPALPGTKSSHLQHGRIFINRLSPYKQPQSL